MYRNQSTFKRRLASTRGFTLIELVLALGVAVTLTAISVPLVNSTLVNYRINNAVSMLTGVINSTRYRAIYNGYQYNVTITQVGGTYQIANKVPPAGSFSNVGAAVPYKGLDPSLTDVKLNNDVTLLFSPSGVVSATSGSMSNINLTYKGQSRTIKVSAYGSVTVTNP